MKIIMDSNEFMLHPLIVDEINRFLLKKQEKSKCKDLYKDNGIINKKLECGDYMFNNILVEHMTLADFCGKIQNDLIFKQAQDMLHTKEIYPDMKLFIMISGSPENIIKLEHVINPDSVIAAWASLNESIPTSFMGNSYFFVAGLIDLFEKHFDGKERVYNPVRKPQEFDDMILTNYCSIVGEKRAVNLLKKFPVPKQLYNATKEQLLEVKHIGEDTAEFIINFSEGREKSWETFNKRKKLKKEIKENKKLTISETGIIQI